MQFERERRRLSFVFFMFFGGFQLHLITIVYLVLFLLFFLQGEFIRRLFQIGHSDEVRLVLFRFLDLVQPASVQLRREKQKTIAYFCSVFETFFSEGLTNFPLISLILMVNSLI